MDRMRKFQVRKLFPELAPPAEDMLRVLYSKDDGITVSELTRELNVPMPAVSRLMRDMEAKGLIERSIHTQDRRSIIVSATAKGKQLYDDFQLCMKEFFTRLVEPVDPESLDRLFAAWNMMMDRMELVIEQMTTEQKARDESARLLQETDEKTIIIQEDKE